MKTSRKGVTFSHEEADRLMALAEEAAEAQMRAQAAAAAEMRQRGESLALGRLSLEERYRRVALMVGEPSFAPAPGMMVESSTERVAARVAESRRRAALRSKGAK